jgi:hypothetical protein
VVADTCALPLAVTLLKLAATVTNLFTFREGLTGVRLTITVFTRAGAIAVVLAVFFAEADRLKADIAIRAGGISCGASEIWFRRLFFRL